MARNNKNKNKSKTSVKGGTGGTIKLKWPKMTDKGGKTKEDHKEEDPLMGKGGASDAQNNLDTPIDVDEKDPSSDEEFGMSEQASSKRQGRL